MKLTGHKAARKKKQNKGITAWKIGNKKYRVTLATGEGRTRTLGYYTDFSEAVRTYIMAHVERYSALPQCNYICPSTGTVIYRAA